MNLSASAESFFLCHDASALPRLTLHSLLSALFPWGEFQVSTRQMVLNVFPLLFVAIEGFVVVLLLLQLSAKTHIPPRCSQVSFDMVGLAGDFIAWEHSGPPTFFPIGRQEEERKAVGRRHGIWGGDQANHKRITFDSYVEVTAQSLLCFAGFIYTFSSLYYCCSTLSDTLALLKQSLKKENSNY